MVRLLDKELGLCTYAAGLFQGSRVARIRTGRRALIEAPATDGDHHGVFVR
jgi:hypothetical protein